MIEWIQRVVFGGVQGLMQSARANYGVDPWVFIIMYFISVPFFYYSLFRMVRALARKLKNEIMLWSTIFLASTVAPFLYVLFFGRNLPWWVYVVIALLIGQGVFSLIRKLTKNKRVPARQASAHASAAARSVAPVERKQASTTARARRSLPAASSTKSRSNL